ncbi:hypothetical protein QR680_000074 [Steinernema hermaphroditum]|uniref:Maltase n=1 Tax=Steinernema hermaphroditum TaxID=289476 RepID=A0AA39GV75_9BILA|nr:hypothetical protein QR680_000074 [Steinernema hermaphroditum]
MWVTAVLLLVAISPIDAFIDPNVRLDCFPDPGASPEACKARGCEWDTVSESATVPLCYFPRQVTYSFDTSKVQSPIVLTKAVGGIQNPFDKDFENLEVSYGNIGATVNVRIAPKEKRYEPLINIPKNPSKSKENLKIQFAQHTSNFSFSIKRESTGTKIWDTSIGGLFFGDQFIQIATFLPSDKIYGFGQNIHQTLKHDLSRYTTWGMFSRDWGPDSKDFNTLNLYGVHPFYMALEPDGKAHGVLILNSNAQEVTTGPGPHLIYRTIGGLLDIYFFPGPTPEDVVQQYLALIGKPFLPAYWAFGFQISHWGYKTLEHMKAAFQRTLDAEIPIDIQVADIDYMDRKLDFTLNPDGDWTGFPAYIDHLHNTNHRLIFILDPGIEADYGSFKRGMDTDASFIEWPRTDLLPSTQDKYPMTKGKKIMLGKVWPDNFVGFPDFLDPTNKTDDWWTNEFKLLHQKAPFDGMWIDMNEPSNFDTNSETDKTMLQCPKSGPDAHLDMPPYQTRNVYQWPEGTRLSTKTLCMFARTARDTQNFYDTKCLYGWSESKSTIKALSATTGQRGAVITRSTFPSSGRYTGTWLGDNTSRWPDLRTSVIGVMEFNMFGIPYVGADICGFNGNTTEELCLRWHQLGAFHSFMRNHNSINQIPQDPGMWPSVAEATKKANHFRYRHLPYLFSLHFAASMKGGTVVRPAFFEFPHDEVTHTLNHQFMQGPAIMVIPVLHEGATTVRGYLPETTDGWYSLYDDNYGAPRTSGFHNFDAPTNYLIPVFARGRQIIPRQVSAETTADSRKNPFELLITSAPNHIGGWDARGRLLWDDGITLVNDFKTHKYYDISFAYQATTHGALITVVVNKRTSDVEMPAFENIEIFGYQGTPNFDTFTVNGKPVQIDLQESTYSPFTQVLSVHAKNIIEANDLSNHVILTIKWKNQ